MSLFAKDLARPYRQNIQNFVLILLEAKRTLLGKLGYLL